MNHLILFTYIAHLSFGVAGVASMAMLHYRMRRKITASLLWIMSCLLASLFLTMLQYYLFSNLEELGGFVAVQYGLGLAIALALYGGVFFLLFRLPKVPTFAAAALTIFVAAIQTGRVLVLLLAPQAAASVRAPSVALISVYLFFLGWMLYRSSGGESDENLSRLLRRLGILTVIFAPASTLFYLVTYRFDVIERLHISLDFIYFSVWSIIVIAAFLRYLSRPTALLEEGKVSPAFISAYKITKREEEVVQLIGLGLSNQEIADRLYVSLTTARTHIYNIFQKTGAGSRVELLRIVSGYRA